MDPWRTGRRHGGLLKQCSCALTPGSGRQQMLCTRDAVGRAQSGSGCLPRGLACKRQRHLSPTLIPAAIQTLAGLLASSHAERVSYHLA
jgi:hypothetical protein